MVRILPGTQFFLFYCWQLFVYYFLFIFPSFLLSLPFSLVIAPSFPFSHSSTTLPSLLHCLTSVVAPLPHHRCLINITSPTVAASSHRPCLTASPLFFCSCLLHLLFCSSAFSSSFLLLLPFSCPSFLPSLSLSLYAHVMILFVRDYS